MASDPVVHYRIELKTDHLLRWFAQVDSFSEGGVSTEFTEPAETWRMAFQLAHAAIAHQRRRQTKRDE